MHLERMQNNTTRVISSRGTKDLSRKSIQAILTTYEASETVRTIIVDNCEVMKWVKGADKPLQSIIIRPRWLKIMSFEKLSADCITLILQHLDLKTIQQLAISSKALHSWCLVAHLNYITTLPQSKVEFPEIVLKLTTTLRINEVIEITGADWLASAPWPYPRGYK
ncbi:hypothetical protein HPULCUR_010393 [Helicostylum pulchrum]|uniref:F-box domain-containing protein n=1 Tax=Helicostylum pulchrum TaxID=562976 RepID=A0ABP9YD45_9FUNG